MDPPSENEIDSLIKLIRKLAPDLVGVNVCSTLFEVASRITKRIKNELDALVVWGGIHPTIRPYQCLEFADIVCIGEGEGPLVELATELSNGRTIQNIENLWIKNNDRIIRNNIRTLTKNLDLIPFPDFSSENKYFLENNKELLSQQEGTYDCMTSRGCPFRCTFCCNDILRRIYEGKGTYVRRRSVDNVIGELVHAKERFKNINWIMFWDDVFTGDSNWTRDFSNKYKKNVNLPFSCYCHPKLIKEETVRLLKDAGLANITMGIQSGSEEFMRKYYERNCGDEDVMKAARLFHKYRIRYSCELIMDNPIETEKDKRATLSLLLKLPKPYDLSMLSLTHFPGAKLTELLLAEGIISENDVEDKKQKGYERWTTTLDLKRDKENLVWDNLYYLARMERMPKRVVIRLSNSAFFKRYPQPLTLLLRLFSVNSYTVRRGSNADMIRISIISKIIRVMRYFSRRLRNKGQQVRQVI